MNLTEVQNIEEKVREADYMGGIVIIPEGHNYVFLTKASHGKVVMMSSVHPPAFDGNVYNPVGDFRLIGEVAKQPIAGTLRKVGNLSTEEILLSNLEELSFKIRAIIGDDSLTAEEKIHAVHCKEHGMIHEFKAHQAPTLALYERQQAIAAADAEVEAAKKKREEVIASFHKPRVRVPS